MSKSELSQAMVSAKFKEQEPGTNYLQRDGFGVSLPDTCRHVVETVKVLSESTSNALVEDLADLVDCIEGGERGDEYNAAKLWFHQMCRRMQKYVDPETPNAVESLAP